METRDQARRRQRRLIMNNDGNDLSLAPAGSPVTAESFIEARTAPLADSQIDSIFYCDGVFNLYTHRSEETEFFDLEPPPDSGERAWLIGRWARRLAAQGHDPLALVARWCRANHREIFWSFRMNDLHDSSRAWLRTRWKQAHADWLMDVWDGFPHKGGALLNYGVAGVREKALRIWRDVLDRFDLDGIELDFFRHPALFRSQLTGGEATPEECDALSELVRRLRDQADAAARRLGHPVLIAIRIPDSVGFCRAMGIDLERWLGEGWVDLLVGGDYFRLGPWSQFAELGRRHGVPAYACIVERRLMAGRGLDEATVLPLWRAEALRAWDGGVDGIYIFNRFDPCDPLFRELGDPISLRRLPGEGAEVFAGPAGSYYRDPGFWLRDGRRFLAGAP